ncbi:potassium channel family protein [Pararhodobacter sp. SW119]|uniref:ion transporter n=1 Tax=Pararhodobacter sp. SW119 TaxID=2780075 RepID=UPI001ADF2A8D
MAKALDPELRSSPGLSPANWAIISLIILSIVTGILETEESLVHANGWMFSAAEMVLFCVFFVEYVLRIWSSVENPRHASRWAYARTPASILDLVTLFAIGASLLGPEGFLLRLARLLRLLRLSRLGRFTAAWQTLARALANRGYELGMSVALAVLMVLISSSLLYLIEGALQPEAFGSIPRAMWWSIATLTTVGYGDVVPLTAWGRLVGAVAAIAGVGLIAMPAGIIAGAVSEVIQQRRRDAMPGAIKDDDGER